MIDYQDFLQRKQIIETPVGLTPDVWDINETLFPFQRDVVKWAVRKGRAAVFLDTGLGKTFVQLEWARIIGETTLIIAPLSVARQTVREAHKLGLEVRYVRHQSEITDDCRLWITNYEMIGDFDFSRFGAVVLDESSILKALDGKTRKRLVDSCRNVRYRLCCTATPAPNDYTELGNHAEFLGVCSLNEMLAMFFINANKEHTFYYGDTAYRKKGSNKGGQEWRLKHHAEQPFFRWLSSWAICMTKPSDLGYDDNGFVLPPLHIHLETVTMDYRPDDQLFFTGLQGIAHRSNVRRETLNARLALLRDIVERTNDQWIVWTGLQDESEAVTQALEGAVEVKGSDSPEYKARIFEAFQDGKFKVLVTKAKIGGFGMNFQNACKMAFFGLNDSWEMWYQAVRREWRFMQTKAVDVYVILSNLETEIYENVMRKDAQARRLREGLIEQIQAFEKGELKMTQADQSGYDTNTAYGQNWTAMLGDSCERLGELADDSIDLSVYSPPFADLYTYSNSERDLGNSRDWDEFFDHYSFIVREILRVTKPGRLTCVHTMDIPAMAQKDGYIGVKDFPGEVIRAYEREGWVFHGRTFIQKNPQAQAIRTHSQALLFVQLAKDSSASRPALIDQILIFRKPGDNAVPITPTRNGEMDNEIWIEWAHGIWTGINESDTLQFTTSRDGGDEKHVCPLQLGTIERCIKLYSNPGETVLTPFMGIGSEAYQAIRFHRKAIGIELKPSYFETAIRNLQAIEMEANTPDLFAFAGLDVPDGKLTMPAFETKEAQ